MTDAEEAAAARARDALAEAMRRERLRIVATLIRQTGNWELAEDAVADAAERALVRWPRDGVPANPAAWLTTTARRRAIDVIRRAEIERAKVAELATLSGEAGTHGEVDDRLRLIFTCCHPALPLQARVALTLKVVCGLSTEAVARVFLTSAAAMSRRLLRAKERIAHAGIPYRVPSQDMLPERLDGVLAVVYLVFTEGWNASADRALAEEAVRLGRVLTGLVPESDEARGLLALMLLQHSRRDARRVDGRLVTLEQQDRTRWDADDIAEALTLLRLPVRERGSYRIQAELAAAHATTRRAEETDWRAIVSLYRELRDLQPSPIVLLNLAVAIGMLEGPRAGLAELDAFAGDTVLRAYPPLHAARGELLARAGRTAAAVAELTEAIALATTEQERVQLDGRRAELDGWPPA
jgi:RNA polymerase sigma-70 factor, ECF subfamily